MARTRPAAMPSVLGPVGAPGMPSRVHPFHGTIRHVGLETAGLRHPHHQHIGRPRPPGSPKGVRALCFDIKKSPRWPGTVHCRSP